MPLSRRIALCLTTMILIGLAACSSTDGASNGDEPANRDQGAPQGEHAVPGEMGGAGIRSQYANLYLNTDSIDDHIGTRDGEFNQFQVECWTDRVVITAGDEVSAEFTVGSQDITFFLESAVFAEVTAEDDVEWGAGSSFQVESFQEILDNGHRVTFTGSASCP